LDCASDADDFPLNHIIVSRRSVAILDPAEINPANVCLGYSLPKLINVVPSGLVTATTRPRTSTSLPTYRMASESFITIGLSACATIAQRSRARIANRAPTRIAKSYMPNAHRLL
jgi:hypothetical protein